jgi:hypothetical protein
MKESPMSIYMPEGTCRFAHERRLKEALDGIGFTTERDLIDLMGGDSRLCDEQDLELARADLRAMGYREKAISLSGCRPVFWRWVKAAYSPDELAARWGEGLVGGHGGG